MSGIARALAGALVLTTAGGLWLILGGGRTREKVPEPAIAEEDGPAPAPTTLPPTNVPPAPAPAPAEDEAGARPLIQQLLALLETGRPLTREQTAQVEALERALLGLGEAAAGPVVARLDQGRLGPEANDRLFNVLRQLPGAAADERVAREARTGSRAATRSMAMDTLAERRTDRALEALATIARTDPQLPPSPLIAGPRDPNDPSTEVPDEQTFTPRMQAMAALAGTKDARAVAVLVDVLRTGPDESLRMEAARNLGGLREDPRAAEALRAAATSDPSAYVRLAALHALSGSSDPALAPLLARIVADDRDAGVRALAGQVLASLTGN